MTITLDYAISVHLLVDEIDYHLNNFVWGYSKVLWCRIVGVDQALDCLREEWLGPFWVLHEVEAENVVKVRIDLLLILKVEIVVEFRKLQYDLYSLRLVITWKAAMLSAFENSVTAFKDEVWTDWVLCAIQALVKLFLLG